MRNDYARPGGRRENVNKDGRKPTQRKRENGNKDGRKPTQRK